MSYFINEKIELYENNISRHVDSNENIIYMYNYKYKQNKLKRNM